MKQNRIVILFSLLFIFVLFNFLTQEIKITSINQETNLDSSDSWVLSRVFINDTDPDHCWSKIAAENDWCYGSGTIGNPYIIENITINYQTVNYGGLIDIRNSNVYFIIRHCTLYKTDVFGRCINLENTNYGKITDNYCSNENGYGIKLKNSNYNLICNNLLSENIHSGISIDRSQDNEIFNNSFIENNFGIELFSCGYNNVSSNEFRRNGRGMYLDGASYCNISKNAFIKDYGGIESHGSINCIFYDNIINLSSYEGILLTSGCTDNLLYGNQLNNKKNAVDNGQRNVWNCSLYGNFWSDYTGRDANDDGIGDTPYIIPGSANGIDYLPIWDDNIEAPPYFHDQQEDFSMIQGNELMNITWQADDINNNYDSYWILKDGIMIENNSWDGSPITYLDLYLLEPGIYNFTCFVNDTDNSKVSDTVFVTVDPDIYPPEINIILPYFFQLCGNKSIDFQLSITEPNLNSTWYSLNNGINVSFIGNFGLIDQNAWDNCGNGTVSIKFYANDTFGNKAFEEVIVRKDTHFPSFVILIPQEEQFFGMESPDFELIIDEPYLDKIWYTINGSSSYAFANNTGKINQDLWSQWGNGTLTITFYVNNTAGNMANNQVQIHKDIISPLINILSPVANQKFGNQTFNFQLSITDFNLHKSWYNLGANENFSFTGESGTINQEAWDNCANGTILITFYANDTLGNLGFQQVNVQKDCIGPLFTILSPNPQQLFGNNTFEFEVSILEAVLDTTWYTLNDSPRNYFTGTTDILNQEAWDSCDNGTVKIIFYGNDTFGNIGYQELIVLKDCAPPLISILSPLVNQVFGNNTLGFRLEIFEAHLNSTWYTLNNGEKYFFIGLTGIINQTAWDACGNGTVSIKFYANDTLSNLRIEEIIVQKDIYIPFIIINLPTPNQYSGPLSPFFNLTIIGTDIDTMWYTVNETYPQEFSDTMGKINQQIWNLFSEGKICIKFYANNSAGNYRMEEVWIIKRTSLTSKSAYAIVVGIADYPGAGNDLTYCDDDALDVYNMLINDYNFKPENIIYLQDSSASKNGITNAFNNIASIIQPDDIFYFYYSGHGGSELVNTGTYTSYIQSPHPYPNYYDYTTWRSSTDAAYIRVHFEILDLEPGYDYLYIGDTYITEGYAYQALTGYGTNFWSDWIPVLNDNRIYLRMITDGIGTRWGFRIDQMEVIRYSNPHYLCSYDSIPSNPSNNYLDTLLDAKLDSLNCDNKYVILDSCNSGGMISESQDINRYIMTACKGGQFSMEDPSLGHGVFTHYLLNSLQNANDQNHDGVISMEECFSYVSSGTRSFSASYGPGYQFHPQQFDGINGQAVLYPSIGSVQINPVNNRLYYSFYLYGHGFLKTLNITVCSVSPTITFKTEEIKYQIISSTGFGYYSGFIDLEEGYTVGGINLLAEVEGNSLKTIELMVGDSDGDGLTDFFEILEGSGLDPNSNDTDADGLNDYDEYYGPTDPLNNDTDSDGLLDGEEVNIYNTDPLLEDSDDDGLNDYDEIMIYLTNPLQEDTDADGLNDYDEIMIYNTSPTQGDSDIDGLNDYDEIIIYLTDPLNNDTDSDQLTDYEEVITYNTDPLQEDSDSDGLTDYEEVITYNTDPLQEDSDSDGLTDGEEINDYNTDPLNGDTDSDTIPDGWEVDHSLDPTTNDTALDPDMDLLINLMEYQYNTHPFNNDTDSDGLMDGIEVYTYGTSPTIDDTDSDGLLDGEEVNIYNTDPLNNDSDLDGLLDGLEVNSYGTDPLNDDTDFDTMPDYWEVVNSLNPLVNDTTLDPDLDNLINIEEYNWDTDPQNPDTDGDGWSDGDEVHVYATDPLDPDSYPPPSTPPGIPGYNTFFLIVIITIIALTIKLKHKEK